MNKTLLEIKHHCNRRLFKFDLLESDTDIVLSNVWTKDFKVTNASYDGLKALKHYALVHNKHIHVLSKNSRVFELLRNAGFHQNLLMKGKGDIMVGAIPFMYSWRPTNGS